jgi:histidinol phosphatase-like enzyme
MNAQRISVFIDRDRTIIGDKNYHKNLGDVALLEGGGDVLVNFKNLAFRIG